MVPRDKLPPVAERYGVITYGEEYIYMVKDSDRIVKFGTRFGARIGTAEVALDNYEGPIRVLLYIGPRIRNDDTSMRDAVGFVFIR
jgi:hypothetical protein